MIFNEFENRLFHRRPESVGFCYAIVTRLYADSWSQASGRNLPPERARGDQGDQQRGEGVSECPPCSGTQAVTRSGGFSGGPLRPRHRKVEPWLRVWNRRFTLKIPRLGPDRDQLAFRVAERVATESFAPPDPAPVPMLQINFYFFLSSVNSGAEAGLPGWLAHGPAPESVIVYGR